jgi:HD superfamily phosphodiesterase
MPSELLAQKDDMLKDRVAIEMKRYFRTDFKRIGHASRVARYAERIAKTEKGSMAVILCAAYLHDIGIHEAERKHGSTAGRFQEIEGPPIARMILTKLGAKADMIDEVCDIVGHHHHPRTEETVNFKVLYDADLITNIEENHKESPCSSDHLRKIVEKSFLTESGRRVAQETLLS